MKSEKSWPVGDVDERAGLLRHRPRRVDKALVIGRDEAERGAGEILGRRITRLVSKIRTHAQFEKLVAEFAGERGDARLRTDEKLGAPRRNDSSAHDECGPPAHVDENRQVAHYIHLR